MNSQKLDDPKLEDENEKSFDFCSKVFRLGHQEEHHDPNQAFSLLCLDIFKIKQPLWITCMMKC